MKNSIFIISIIALVFTSCETPKVEIHDLLKNKDAKDEIFKTITSDYELMKEFTTQMVNSGSASQVFQTDPTMVNHLINNDGMVALLKDNPQAKEHMMSMMLKDTLFNSQLIEKAIQDEKNTSKMIKQLETNKIITKGCAKEAKEETVKKFAPVKPTVKKK
jgi:hypothetical protein